MSITTAPIKSQFRTAQDLEGFVTVDTLADGSFTVTFESEATALKAVAQAKDASWNAYIRNGGNPRNRRSHSTQFAAVTKAIWQAATR